MESKWIVFAVILIFNAVVAFVIAALLLRRPPKPGIHSMSYMLFGLSLWSLSYAMITLSGSLEVKHFWLKVENIGILTVPVLWFLFAMKYTRLDKWLTGKPLQFVLWIIPVVSLVFLFSRDWFTLYYTSTQLAS